MFSAHFKISRFSFYSSLSCMDRHFEWMNENKSYAEFDVSYLD